LSRRVQGSEKGGKKMAAMMFVPFRGIGRSIKCEFVLNAFKKTRLLFDGLKIFLFWLTL
jgi:hypothetical protein